MLRTYFEKELEKLKIDMTRMGALVEEAMGQMLIALKNQDIQIAERIISGDDEVDFMEKKIEKQCLVLLARQQPLAVDLRAISAALKIITELERIGDHAADIAEITMKMAGVKYMKPLVDIPIMIGLTVVMVNRAIDAYVRQDVELALNVCASDREVNELYLKVLLELINTMKRDSQTIDQAMNLVFIAKYLEKMGDHATNIAEWVIYNVTGVHNSGKKVFAQ
ncbi:MAG: phosphate signaling complex protein PhoU [Negativicutes bacterium]